MLFINAYIICCTYKLWMDSKSFNTYYNNNAIFELDRSVLVAIIFIVGIVIMIITIYNDAKANYP